jgi:hypothetical protein
MGATVTLAAVLAAATSAWAQIGPWVDVGPAGGRASIVAVDATDANVAYAAVGATIWKSTNGGVDWTPTAPLPESHDSEVLGLVTAGATVYASHEAIVSDYPCFRLGVCTHHYRVLESADGGATWASLFEDTAGGFPGLYSAAPPGRFLTVVPGASATIYAPARAALIRSLDGGATWTNVGAGLPPSERLTALAVDPSQSTVVYVASRADDEGPGSVHKSTDGGTTFAPASTGLDTPEASDVRVLVIDPTTPARSYVATAAGVFTSTNAAASWQPAGPGLPTPVTALALDPTHPATLYAGTSGTGANGIYESGDGGASWTLVDTSLRALAPKAGVLALAVAPGESDTVYAGTDTFCVVGSHDAGATWSTSRRTGCGDVFATDLVVTPASPATLFVADGTPYVHRSDDDGRSWTARDTGLQQAKILATAPSDPTVVYAGGEGVARSVDGGDTWHVRPALPLFPSAPVSAIAVDPRDARTLYVDFGLGIVKSTDGGGTWFLPSPLSFAESVLLIDPSAPDTLYAQAFAGLYEYGETRKSTDGGASWASVGPEVEPAALALDPGQPGRLYALRYPSVFLSVDGAATWSELATPAPFVRIAVDPATSAVYGIQAAGDPIDAVGQVLAARPGEADWRPLGPPVYAPDPSVSFRGDLVVDPLGRALYLQQYGVRRLRLVPCEPGSDGPSCTASLARMRVDTRRGRQRRTVVVGGRVDAGPIDTRRGLTLGLVFGTDAPARTVGVTWNAEQCAARGPGLACAGADGTLRLRALRRRAGAFKLRAKFSTDAVELPRGPVIVDILEHTSGTERVARLARCAGRGRRTTCRQ